MRGCGALLGLSTFLYLECGHARNKDLPVVYTDFQIHMAFGVWTQLSLSHLQRKTKKKNPKKPKINPKPKSKQTKKSIALSISKVTSQQDGPQCLAHDILWQVWSCDSLMVVCVCVCKCVYCNILICREAMILMPLETSPALQVLF